MFAIFKSEVGQHLHAHTNPKKWLSVFQNRFFQRGNQSVFCAQIADAIAKMADPRQNNPVGRPQQVGI